MTKGLSPGLLRDLERQQIDLPVDLAALLDVVFRLEFGYAIGGSPWRQQSPPHEAGVYRQGGTMTKSTGRTPAAALARALVDALDAEAQRTSQHIATRDD